MAEAFPSSRRALIYLALAFAITWMAWWSLVGLARDHHAAYGESVYMTLYVLGGLGPTLAAYGAVWLTRSQAPVREFNRRVLRWRVRPGWYLVALGLPALLGFVAIGIALALRPALTGALAIRPWYQFPLLLAMMLVGGGLEEFGWRGVMQEEWGVAMGQGRAALLIGPVWALWHLPLFFLPGVAQFHAHFPLFLLGIMGNALLLGWLYSRTRSILLCVLMHAAANAITAMGIVIPSGHGLSLIGPCLNLGVGALLFLSGGRHVAAGAVDG
ncbi:type II CAAX endopeptidase family protein [Dyella sp. C9]|uniref:type II CAAX endopeptidase family protein n=1 Tax=Dyella sp. C9 TaxID=2202154 RepID=UPI000DEFE613|nr:type II CAAX endopeptidase family protein [Dyella sp. C9]